MTVADVRGCCPAFAPSLDWLPCILKTRLVPSDRADDSRDDGGSVNSIDHDEDDDDFDDQDNVEISIDFDASLEEALVATRRAQLDAALLTADRRGWMIGT